jgi:hypothetical protein
MIVFDSPISRFTAIDLMTLFGLWPEARHRDGPDGGSLLVIAAGCGPWLVIERRRDGRYRAADVAGHVFSEGGRLADLALEGPD